VKVSRHVRRLGQIVTSPRDAWLLARMLGWSLLLPVLKRTVPLSRLVALLQLDAQVDRRDPQWEEQLSAMSDWVFRSRPRRSRDNCLDRSLVTYRYLGRAGAEPTIVVGVAKSATDAITGHVWVTVDGEPVHDDIAGLANFVALTAFNAHGRAIQY
jgi:hypothetical protein